MKNGGTWEDVNPSLFLGSGLSLTGYVGFKKGILRISLFWYQKKMEAFCQAKNPRFSGTTANERNRSIVD